jgi:hypothetical protein
VWFKDKEALAVVVKKLYNPVPFPTIALAAAAVSTLGLQMTNVQVTPIRWSSAWRNGKAGNW